MEKITAPRGTRDVLPGESEKWQALESSLRSLAHRFGFREIRFPTFEDIALFSKNISNGLKIKAAGGIRSFEDAENYINLGASRLGTSSLVKIMKKEELGSY